MNKTQQRSAKLPKNYENNPFFVATKGLELLFSKAKPIAILFAVLAGISLLGGGVRTSFSGYRSPSDDSNMMFRPENFSVPAGIIIVVLLIVLAVFAVSIFIGTVIRGVADYASAELARGRDVGFSDALKAVFEKFWGYLLVQIIVAVKIFLWSLLLIIPGIIMSYRYSLAGVAYFEANKSGNKAVKHSLSLTKGAFLTVFASQSLLNILSFGVIKSLLAPGTNAVLYRQLNPLAGKQKPAAHLASVLTLLGTVLLIVLLVAFVGLIALLAISSRNG